MRQMQNNPLRKKVNKHTSTNDAIEELRAELEKAINAFGLKDPKTLEISQRLDELIFAAMINDRESVYR